MLAACLPVQFRQAHARLAVPDLHSNMLCEYEKETLTRDTSKRVGRYNRLSNECTTTDKLYHGAKKKKTKFWNSGKERNPWSAQFLHHQARVGSGGDDNGCRPLSSHEPGLPADKDEQARLLYPP